MPGAPGITHSRTGLSHSCDWWLRRHPHRDAEIFSYIVDGELSHADSMGFKESLPRGCVQYLSAGSGITHSVRDRSLSLGAAASSGLLNTQRTDSKPVNTESISLDIVRGR